MSGCKLEYDAWNGDYACGCGSAIDCDECKYGKGRKDPNAWVNASEDDRKGHIKELRDKRRAIVSV